MVCAPNCKFYWLRAILTHYGVVLGLIIIIGYFVAAARVACLRCVVVVVLAFVLSRRRPARLRSVLALCCSGVALGVCCASCFVCRWLENATEGLALG